MSRILLVTSTNLYLTPYIKNYLDVSDNCFDIAYWDRHYLDEKNNSFERINRFVTKDYKETDSKLHKFLGYIQFCSFIKKTINKNKYEKVIFLQSFIAVFLTNFLVRKLKNNYVVDIRDFTFENISFYKKIESKCFKYARFCCISSEGYKTFLPKKDYVLVHNYSKIDLKIRSFFSSINHSSSNPIKISFIGLIRFNEQNQKIISFFNNDPRFQLCFIGKGASELEPFIKENNFTNVLLVDYFEPSKTLDFYKNTDFIMNLYGNNTPLLDFALSNKLYFSGNLYIPILVCPHTFMEKMTQKYSLGLTVDLFDKNVLDRIASFWSWCDRDDFIKHCDEFITDVDNDMNIFKEKVSSFINEEN